MSKQRCLPRAEVALRAGFRAVRLLCGWVSGRDSAAFYARNALRAGSARDSAAIPTQDALRAGSALEWGIFLRAELTASLFCAGMGYLFLRRMEKCSRLRGKKVPNPPEMLRGNVLRGNGVSFSAQNGKM